MWHLPFPILFCFSMPIWINLCRVTEEKEEIKGEGVVAQFLHIVSWIISFLDQTGYPLCCPPPKPSHCARKPLNLPLIIPLIITAALEDFWIRFILLIGNHLLGIGLSNLIPQRGGILADCIELYSVLTEVEHTLLSQVITRYFKQAVGFSKYRIYPSSRNLKPVRKWRL